MAAPKSTIWELEPHTRAKHAILRRYLQAWTVILTQGGFPEVVYIDGFAGPGRYAGGEDGSPIIALRAALDHHITSRMTFLFVEEKADRAQVLRDIVDSLPVPGNFLIQIEGGTTFEEAYGRFSATHRARDGRLPPMT